MRNFHQHGIDTRGRISGKVKTICPQCNETRGHKGDKSLSVDLDRGLCYCHHCGFKLYVPDDAEERRKQQRLKELQNGKRRQEAAAYSGRYPFTNSGDIRSVRWRSSVSSANLILFS